VQKVITKILNSIYENDFLDCSFGFRPKRNGHDALKILNHYIERKYINYVVDAEENIQDLVARLKQKSYGPVPVRRVAFQKWELIRKDL
jgi:hypothetical protein